MANKNKSIDDFSENEDVINLTSELFDNIQDSDEFDYRIDYDWSVPTVELNKEQDNIVESFLTLKVEEYKENQENNELEIPCKPDGSTYELSDLTDEQSSIICYLLKYIKLCKDTEDEEQIPQCHITLRGIAGSGKSLLIKTLVTVVKRMFGKNNAIMLCAPTGCAAYNIGGSTCHSELHIAPKSEQQISKKNMLKLRDKMNGLFVLVIDERSMISAKLLQAIEDRFRLCMHNGNYNNCHWGRLPMFVFVGDEFQLPPVQKGMFYAFDGKCQHNGNEKIGYNLFRNAAKKTFQLTKSIRQDEKHSRYNNFLKYTRGEDQEFIKNYIDFDFALSKILNLENYTQDEINFIKTDSKTLHLFANREPKDDFNQKKF